MLQKDEKYHVLQNYPLVIFCMESNAILSGGKCVDKFETKIIFVCIRSFSYIDGVIITHFYIFLIFYSYLTIQEAMSPIIQMDML